MRRDEHQDGTAEVLTIAALRERWECSDETVSAAIAAGLPYFTLGRAVTGRRGGRKLYRFRRADVQAFEAGKVTTRNPAPTPKTSSTTTPTPHRRGRRADPMPGGRLRTVGAIR